MFKKHACTLMANNVASTSRLKLVMEDDPDVLMSKFGFDKYDAEDMAKALKETATSGNGSSVGDGGDKGSHHHHHKDHSVRQHRSNYSHHNTRFTGSELYGKDDEPYKVHRIVTGYGDQPDDEASKQRRETLMKLINRTSAHTEAFQTVPRPSPQLTSHHELEKVGFTTDTGE